MLPAKRTGFTLGLALGLLAIAATRLPQFLSGRMMLDGDESVVGVMAMHALRGDGLPLFFYGQDYGFAPLEVGTAALFFQCFGVSVVAFKLAMLMLWSAGWLLWVTAVRRLADERTAILAAVLLATMPAWGVIGLKGWATCLTSFIALGLAVHALSRLTEPRRTRPAWAALLGGAAAILWVTQAHAMLTLLPFGLLYAVPRRRWADLLVATAVFALVVGAIRWTPLPEGVIRSVAPGSILGRSLANLPAPAEGATRFATRLQGVFSGSYYFSVPIEVGAFTRAAGDAWLVALAGSLLAVAFVAPLRGQRLARVCALASLPSLGVAALVLPDTFQYRYLLPLTCVAAILVAACLAWLLGTGRAGRVLASLGIVLLVALGSISMAEFRKSSWASMSGPTRMNERQALDDLVAGLQAEGIRHVFTKSEMLRWKLAFASEDGVVASTAAWNDRYPDHARAFSEALEKGERVALVGERYWMEELLRGGPPPGLPEPRIVDFGFWILATYGVDAEALRNAVAPRSTPAPPR